MTALVSMVALGAVCWVFRIAFVTLLPAERLPAQVRSSLEHLAPAVLAALVAVELVGLTEGASAAHAATLLVGTAVLGVVGHRTRRLSLVSGLGLVLVVILDLVIPRL
jgi:branched-subunit amino acid transport protein